MKKILMITIVLILNLIFHISKIDKVSVEKIDLNLKYDELGILFLKLPNINSLLLCKNDLNILYIIDIKEDKDIKLLKSELMKINYSIDFIITNKDYHLNFGAPTKIVTSSLSINDITFNNHNYTSISYNNNSFCINNTNCDYIYFTNKSIKINDNKVLFYNQGLNINNSIYTKWIDTYQISDKVYTILKIKDQYEVLEILKNI